MNNWIPVSERLPELNEPLIIKDEDGTEELLDANYKVTVLAYEPGFGIYKAELRGRSWSEISSISIRCNAKPTHWMPLPDITF